MPVVINGNYNKQLNTASKLKGQHGYSGARAFNAVLATTLTKKIICFGNW
jgi:hypothetical protein